MRFVCGAHQRYREKERAVEDTLRNDGHVFASAVFIISRTSCWCRCVRCHSMWYFGKNPFLRRGLASNEVVGFNCSNVEDNYYFLRQRTRLYLRIKSTKTSFVEFAIRLKEQPNVSSDNEEKTLGPAALLIFQIFHSIFNVYWSKYVLFNNNYY